MHLEDFPMDAHACPLKFGSCKWPLCSRTPYQHVRKHTHTHTTLIRCHYLIQLEAWPSHQSPDKGWQCGNSCSPRATVCQGPSGPLRSTLPGPARPRKTLACTQLTDLCLSKAELSVIFPEHHTSCSLLTATATLHHPWKDSTRDRMMEDEDKNREGKKMGEKGDRGDKRASKSTAKVKKTGREVSATLSLCHFSDSCTVWVKGPSLNPL